MSDKPCVDCVRVSAETGAKIPSRKPALKADGTPVPGNRCVSHEREKKKRARQDARERRWEKVYSISAEQYQALYQAQGGKCAICGHGKGLTRALHVDHDHACCPGPTSCGECVRGLLDSPCNSYLGQIRDSKEAAQRLLDYLTNPPAGRILHGL